MPFLCFLTLGQSNDYSGHLGAMYAQLRGKRVHVRYHLSLGTGPMEAEASWDGVNKQQLKVLGQGRHIDANRIGERALVVDYSDLTYEEFPVRGNLQPIYTDSLEGFMWAHPTFLYPGPIEKFMRSAKSQVISPTASGWKLHAMTQDAQQGTMDATLELNSKNLPVKFSFKIDGGATQIRQDIVFTELTINGPATQYSVDPPLNFVPLYLPDHEWTSGDEEPVTAWPIRADKSGVTTVGASFKNTPTLIFVTGRNQTLEHDARQAFDEASKHVAPGVKVAHVSISGEKGAFHDVGGFWEKRYADYGLPVALLVRKDGFIAMAWMGFDAEDVKEMVLSTQELIKTGTVFKD